MEAIDLRAEAVRQGYRYRRTIQTDRFLRPRHDPPRWAALLDSLA